MARSGRRAAPLGDRWRRPVGEEGLVRGEAILCLARDQGLQDAHPRAAVEVPQLHGLRGLRRSTPEARVAAVAPRIGGARRADRPQHPRPDAAAHRAGERILRRSRAAGAARRSGRPAARRDPRATRLPGASRPRLPHAGPPVAHAVGRRSAAHQPHDRARHVAHQHAVRAGRTLDRAAPARHAPRHRSDAAVARQRQLAARRRARSADHARGRPHRGSGARPRRARRAHRVQRDPGRTRRAFRHVDGAVPVRPQGCGARRRASRPAAPRRAAADRAWRHGTQPAEPRCRDPARPPRVRHGRLGLGQVHPGAGRAVCRVAASEGQAHGSAGSAPRTARRGARRRGGDGGPDGHRPYHALEPGQLRGRVRCDPQALRGGSSVDRARLHARHVQLQFRQRPLPDLRRQRFRARRDAVPLGRVPALPRLRRAPLSPGDPRGEARARRRAREEHRRRAGDDRL